MFALDPTGGLSPQTSLFAPFKIFLDPPPVNPLHCKLLGTPMRAIQTQ